jgi:hypothetical protein
MKDDLNKLKVGDDVIVRKYQSPSTVHKVTRITATQISIEGVYPASGEKYVRRFKKDTGREIGAYDSYRHPYLEAGTPERIADIAAKQHRRELIESIKQCDVTKLRTHTLECIRSWMYDSGNYIEPKKAE